jgi:hypothetical protein
MATRSFGRLLWILAVVAAIGVGYLAGLQEGQKRAVRMLQTEATGNLTQRVEALSLLQLGQVSRAVAQLEQEADQLTLSIAGNQDADRRACWLPKPIEPSSLLRRAAPVISRRCSTQFPHRNRANAGPPFSCC